MKCRLQEIEYGVETLIQYFSKVNTDRYRPLAKEVLKCNEIQTVIMSLFSLAPPGISSLIVPT